MLPRRRPSSASHPPSSQLPMSVYQGISNEAPGAHRAASQATGSARGLSAPVCHVLRGFFFNDDATEHAHCTSLYGTFSPTRTHVFTSHHHIIQRPVRGFHQPTLQRQEWAPHVQSDFYSWMSGPVGGRV